MQKLHHDVAKKESTFEEGDPVYVKTNSSGSKWLEAVIAHKTGPLSYLVELAKGEVQRRHVNQTIRRTFSKPMKIGQEDFPTFQRNNIEGGEQAD